MDLGVNLFYVIFKFLVFLNHYCHFYFKMKKDDIFLENFDVDIFLF